MSQIERRLIEELNQISTAAVVQDVRCIKCPNVLVHISKLHSIASCVDQTIEYERHMRVQPLVHEQYHRRSSARAIALLQEYFCVRVARNETTHKNFSAISICQCYPRRPRGYWRTILLTASVQNTTDNHLVHEVIVRRAMLTCDILYSVLAFAFSLNC